jgi:uncharacterized protein DUF3551
MRFLLFMLAILVATGAFGSRAQAQNYPWCAVLDMGDAAYNCGFVTRDQCMVTVSGIGGFCEPNTQYQPPPGPHAQRQLRH